MLLLIQRAVGAATHLRRLVLAADTTVAYHQRTLRDINTRIRRTRPAGTRRYPPKCRSPHNVAIDKA